jgi:hypothetical protein
LRFDSGLFVISALVETFSVVESIYGGQDGPGIHVLHHKVPHQVVLLGTDLVAVEAEVAARRASATRHRSLA